MSLSTLDRKLLRDLGRMKGQAISIALVIASGVAVYVLMLSTLDSVQLTRSIYYDRYRFADVFASLKRAPLGVLQEIAAIPGVAQTEARVVVDVTVDLAGYNEPIVGRLISIPAGRRPELCDLFIREGRYLEPGRDDEVLVSANFAEAHRLRPGDQLAAIINGRRKELRISGLALSPEYVYNIRPGEIMPDDVRFGILWMERRALATAYQMDGAFNDILLRLRRGASEEAVIERLDQILAPYGSLASVPRRLQTSNWYLENEFQQLDSFGSIIPVIFLGVAAFLLNVVLTRIVAVQREQIGAIKALGYSSRSLGFHVLKFALLIALFGSLLGLLAGAWMGHAMTELYNRFFHFPILVYRLGGDVVLKSVGISLVVAAGGAVIAARQALRLPPAEAMRPSAPAVYHLSLVERLGLKRTLSQSARIMLRSIERRPWRSLVSVAGISAATVLLVVGTFSEDAINDFIDIQFNQAQRYDVMVSLVEPASPRAIYELERLPGVQTVEPFRAVPVRLVHRHHRRDLAINGLPSKPCLNRILDASSQWVELPPEGLVLSSSLASTLDISAGDTVELHVREGRQPRLRVAVTQLVDDYLGVNAYMDLGALRDLIGEGETLSGAFLRVDAKALDRLYYQLKHTPAVAGVALKGAAIESFEGTFSEMIGTMRFIYTIFAGLIALGVVYNSARISLAERSRELATLRVIGFSKREVSQILLGELFLITLVSIPVGLLLGYLAVLGVVEATASEAFRFPATVSLRTQFLAAGSIATAAWISALLVKRRLDRIDLVESLKLRE